ncbi:major outer membrane protein TSA22 [Orientia tsutsugamushi]|uniref:Putative sta22 protein n=1 Tax=Orientia tsutsugamushi str. TA716 TaxID=1359175 RepID=A0A0F3P773_ORITS|nr:major outer membrane protein TSA22 [Orientia tsutsugamushi]KJV76138.1 putative sta22 protein [Orientia tsutsugamushi str. TA716]
MSKEATELKESMDQAMKSASQNSSISAEQKLQLENEKKELQEQISDITGKDEQSQQTTMEKLKEWMLKIKDFITSKDFTKLVDSAVQFVQTAVKVSAEMVQAFTGMKEKGIMGVAEGIQTVTTGLQNITQGVNNMIEAGEAAKKHFSSPGDKIKEIKEALGAEGLAKLQAASAGLQSNASIASPSASVSTPTAARTQHKDSIAR